MAVESDGAVESAECTDPSITEEAPGALKPQSRAWHLRRAAKDGRHRLPTPERRAVAVTTPRVSSSSAVDSADPDEKSVPVPGEQTDDVSGAHDDNARGVSSSVGGRRARVIAFGVLPAIFVIFGGTAGYMTWTRISAGFLRQARVESVRAASDGAAALLTYHADSVESDFRAARERLTGNFKTSYTAYAQQVVIPDSHRKHISAVATVPAAASLWTSTTQAVVMVFVNQTFNSDFDPPTATASSVRVTLDKVGGRWLISDFKPV